MKTLLTRLASSVILLLVLSTSIFAADSIKGIYISQTTLEDTKLFTYIVENAKATGINTFVVDMDIPSKRYQKNIALLKENGIKYVARVVMFPGGGTHDQITNKEYWKKKYKLVQAAIGYGAQAIQLDYIRYNTKSGSSPEHSKNVLKVLTWFKEQLADQKVPLEIDVFGIASYGEEKHIGQNIPLFDETVDMICPMVYPSHYTPFKQHAATPYETVYDSLIAIEDQFKDKKMTAKLVPYIELSNYHYLLSHTKKVAYIQAQLKAVKDADADGWYAWSPNNYYDILFEVLKNKDPKPAVAENDEAKPETTKSTT